MDEKERMNTEREKKQQELEQIAADLKKYIEEKDLIKAKSLLLELNVVDVADILNELDPKTTLILFRTLPKDMAVEVFARFDKDQQKGIIDSSTDKELKYILNELFFDDMIDMIEEMPANVVNKILKASTPEDRKLINQFLKYEEDTAGSIMTIEYASLEKNMTAKEALMHLKYTGANTQTIYTSYVMNSQRVLEGTVSLRTLVMSEEDVKVEDIMETNVIYVYVNEDRESVAKVFQKYDFVAIPVVDLEKRLIGIITVDDIMDVIEQEATEDFQIMAATTPTEEKYLDASVFSLAKNRILWLLILMISATISAGIIGNYSDILGKLLVLNAFIPMLMDTGGNAGSQSSTLVIRGISTGEIEFSDLGKVLWKEFRVSIVVGLVLAAVNFARIMLVSKVQWQIALTVSLTIIGTICIAKMLGGLLPLIANKVGLDPAIMASPMITTIADASTLVIYFKLAQLILKI